MKVALFDFCETLVNFQTADAFVDFVRGELNIPRMHRMEKLRYFLQRCGIISRIESFFKLNFSLNKRLKLYQLKGIAHSEIIRCAEGYYEKRIKPSLINSVISELNKKKEEGFKLYIVSGGYDVYIKRFVLEYGLDGMIASKILFKNGICMGRLDGVDCMGEKKVLLLNTYFKNVDLYTVAYSDSISDLPLLMWADDGIVVSNKKRTDDWIVNNKFKVLLWE